MIVWAPLAVNEKPLLRGKAVLPVYSGATISNPVCCVCMAGADRHLLRLDHDLLRDER